MDSSTRLAARLSDCSSVCSVRRPALSSSIGRPDIDPDVSNNSKHGQRCSGLSIKSPKPASKPIWEKSSDIGGPLWVERSTNAWPADPSKLTEARPLGVAETEVCGAQSCDGIALAVES